MVIHREKPMLKNAPDQSSEDVLLFQPNLSLNGPINDQTLVFFLGRLSEIRASDEDLRMEINTDGGDADVARRIALEVRLFVRHSGRKAFCVGKTKVYSAGVTIFAAFPKVGRYLTDDAVLLVHERRLETTLSLNGPLKACVQIVSEQLELLKTAEKLEREGFAELVKHSSLTPEDLYERATTNCYIGASDALSSGLIHGILR